MPHPRLSHKIAFPPNQVPDWALANTGPAPHVFGAGDRIDLFAPGSAPPVATLPLQGISVPAGGVTVVSLPIAGLAPGPYTVETRWLDPGTTTAMVVRHGIREAFDLELHLPGGRTIAPGATIPAELGTWDGVPVAYALVLGLAPGALVLPNGAVAPIVLDPLVVRSLADGLGGLLTANRGAMIPERCGLAPGPVGATATGLGLTHPGSPALAGVVLRVAAVAWTANLGLFVASQPEEIALR
jgi:hypothetical protein